ncbi:hypothetical protein [Sutcliffiella cohnii]|uniref:hypothetical protein n=1 Tax=Sutcliffiella cohnii TaxID=33932 RepID=UPI0008372C7E|nr:hypothetical protein [Sutcliffiella cohnii]
MSVSDTQTKECEVCKNYFTLPASLSYQAKCDTCLDKELAKEKREIFISVTIILFSVSLATTLIIYYIEQIVFFLDNMFLKINSTFLMLPEFLQIFFLVSTGIVTIFLVLYLFINTNRRL